MTLLSSSIPNFVNGVSQQPFTLRLTSQGEVQENGLSTVSSGLRKRPPTEHIAKISETPLDDCFIHTIDRDGVEQYQVIVTNGDLQVYDLAGVQKTVNFTNKAYLNTTASAGETFALTTVADYTFITNKTVIAQERPDVSPERPFEALISVKLGNYGKTYSIFVDGLKVASYITPNGTEASESIDLGTDAIAARLYAGLIGAGTYTGLAYNQDGTSYSTTIASTPTAFAEAPWVTEIHGSTIYIKNSTTDFTVTCEDGFNNNAMVAIKGTLQKFTDLPANPRINNFLVEITGDNTSGFDNYWVKFEAAADDAVGVWKEAIGPNVLLGLDATTMPHQLVREADGTFSFKPSAWADRKVGDIDSNASPTFVGNTINDVFFFQNRLGFLSDENFIMTETGKYFNPYRTTVLSLLDSDPVDVSAATNKVSILTHAVGFNKQLLLFSRQQQFIVDSTDIMSPKKVPIKPSTDFFVNTRAKPVTAGRNVYFSVDKGSWSAVREYFADLNNITNDATDITSHVPTYVPSGIVKIAAGINEDVLVMLSDVDRTKLFIYKYYFSGNEKLQSSWSVFTHSTGGQILNCDFIKSVLYMVVTRVDGTYLEKMDFSVGASNVGEPFRVHLDRKVQIPTTSLSFSGGYTTIAPEAVGYTPEGDDYMVVTKGGGGIKPGQLATVDLSSGIRLKGDYTNSALTFGQKFNFKYQISPLAARMTIGNVAKSADTEGRTQIRKIAFNHADTGYYKVLVTPIARATSTYVFSGKTLGTPSALIGGDDLATGRLVAAVMSQNTTVKISVESDMPLPVSLFSADWEGFYVKRSRQV
jgi:hypothetical protein